MAEIDVWSCGGGTQSAAIAALIVQGRLPKPDVACMVNTEREKSATWSYMQSTLQPELEKVGVDLVVIDKSQFATVDLYAHNGDFLLPAYTTLNGNASKMPTFCSNEWKRRVVQRYVRSLGIKRCRLWLGMSVDEPQRVKDSKESWCTHYYPLIYEVWFRRSDCVRLVAEMGWLEPPRSACWMCPNMSQREWIEMKESRPEDFQAAVALERQVR